MSAPRDAPARERALDPTTSFVVQAPAGSGKTELLTRRILTLLATVEEPEQVVAITFTRKAAAEMRQRVVELLRAARSGAVPVDGYEAAGLALARRALERDTARGWRLVDDPQRLALGTIDALATRLAHRLPLVSMLGAPSGVAEEARDLYLEAARRFIEGRLERLDLVLLRLGNRFERLQSLLADLLGVREQWMRVVMPCAGAGTALRAELEAMLERLVVARLEALASCCPAVLHAELPPLARRAAHWLTEQARVEGAPLDAGARALIDAFADLAALPDPSPDAVPAWCAIARLLLTEGGTCRTRLDRSIGFPAKGAAKALGTDAATLGAHKDALQGLLGVLADEGDFVERLHAVRSLPAPRYTDEDWAVLEQLVGLLPELVAELHVLFGEEGRLDFPEIAQRAVVALGSDERPTDLALSMDLDLRHLLVDEFQDTSRAQWSLFERLVAGWEAGDGRTFFVVGDPMQSIYRFREGDVALFLKARDEGIGAVTFESLRLEVNFRSAPPVVAWVNATFAALFPRVADPGVGAVPYAASSAYAGEAGEADGTGEAGGSSGSGVIEHGAGDAGAGGASIHALPGASPEAEAEVVAALVAAALATGPGHTVGILVRSRAAARTLVPALQARAIRFRAVDMAPLGERPVVRDLVALTLALRSPHDRLSWLAVLRGPLCGLTLADLHALAGDDAQATLPARLGEAEHVARLSEDGRARVARLLEVIGPATERAARAALVPWVEAVWLRLGGPAACTAPEDLDAAERCLARLVELERDGRIWRRADVARAVERLFAADPVDEASARVQLMTVHKSKGLEFDTVILPALDKRTASDASRLVDWHESTLDGEPHLLFAPIDPPNAPASHRNPIIAQVRVLRARAEAEERLRLLYVACTRARRHLHLTTPLAVADDGSLRRPPSTSFLHPLFDAVGIAHAASDGSTPGGDAGRGVGTGPSVATPIIAAASAMRVSAMFASTASASGEAMSGGAMPEGIAPPLQRTALDWRLPAFDRFDWRVPRPLARSGGRVGHGRAGAVTRDVGTVVHRALLRLSGLPVAERRPPDRAARERFARELRNLGVSETLLDEAAGQVALAVGNTLEDPRGRWVLDPGHEACRSAWTLTVPESDGGRRLLGVRRVVIDRTFVDAGGTRWIVEHKIGAHAGGDVEGFLDRETERYREPLERCAELVARLDPRPLRVGLWFPLVRGWREFAPAASVRAGAGAPR